MRIKSGVNTAQLNGLHRYDEIFPSWICAATSLRSFRYSNGTVDRDSQRRQLIDALGFRNVPVAAAKQIHSAHISIIGNPGYYPDSDGLITVSINLFLSVVVADCYPIFLWCTQPKCVALVHAGWRGTASEIVVRAIELMGKGFQAPPTDLHALIGPGICAECYPVGVEVAKRFPETVITRKSSGEFHLDLRMANSLQMQRAGIPAEHISFDQRCTFEHSDAFFSYRRDSNNTGRNFALIGII
jgi:polyphenol oxidase